MATRPTAQNGLGLTPAQAQAELAHLKALFSVRSDTRLRLLRANKAEAPAKGKRPPSLAPQACVASEAANTPDRLVNLTPPANTQAVNGRFDQASSQPPRPPILRPLFSSPPTPPLCSDPPPFSKPSCWHGARSHTAIAMLPFLGFQAWTKRFWPGLKRHAGWKSDLRPVYVPLFVNFNSTAP